MVGPQISTLAAPLGLPSCPTVLLYLGQGRHYPLSHSLQHCHSLKGLLSTSVIPRKGIQDKYVLKLRQEEVWECLAEDMGGGGGCGGSSAWSREGPAQSPFFLLWAGSVHLRGSFLEAGTLPW